MRIFLRWYFWLVLKLEISYNRVIIISWRILASFRGFFEDYNSTQVRIHFINLHDIDKGLWDEIFIKKLQIMYMNYYTFYNKKHNFFGLNMGGRKLFLLMDVKTKWYITHAISWKIPMTLQNYIILHNLETILVI